MSIAVEHGRFILTAINKSERILLPTASRCKRGVYQVQESPETAWTIFVVPPVRLLPKGGRS